MRRCTGWEKTTRTTRAQSKERKMMKPIGFGVTLAILFASSAFATHNNNHNPPPPQNTSTTTLVTESYYMGMSNVAPPSAGAAASQGVRTEETTLTIQGNTGQIQQFDNPNHPDYHDLSACTGCQVINTETEITDYPGANR
jgi:hypothetical protein